ncbi:MAG: protein kinase [Deltaproteobacteria bacterium]|nr:protein kinase [Deltaproteobacteria bacterium]
MTDKSIKLDIAISIFIVLLFIAFSYKSLPFCDSIDRHIYDTAIRFSPSNDLKNDHIMLVDIDDRSMAELGPWPWPRDLLANMVDLLKQNGIRLIGLNILLHEKENRQALLAMETIGESLDPAVKAKMTETLDKDLRLVETIQNSGNVVLPLQATLGNALKSSKGREHPALNNSLLAASNISPSVHERLNAEYLLLPYADLSLSAMGLGHNHITPDTSMKGRIHPAFISYHGSLIPSFPLRLAIGFLNEHPTSVKVTDEQILLKNGPIPLINGEMLIRFPSGLRFSRFSFADLLTTPPHPSKMKGKVALIGFDLANSVRYDTPISSRMPENDLTAYILSDIINHQYIERPVYLFYIEMAVLLFLGLFASFILTQKGQLIRSIWSLGLIVLVVTTGFIFLSWFHLWLKTAYIISCLAMIYVVVSGRRFIVARESHESSRLLGINYQNQGLLDLAFDKFRKLPLNEETKNLIYGVGLEWEKKRIIGKAVMAYEYINKNGGFKDLDTRIPRLQELDKSSTIGSYEGAQDGNILVESSTGAITKVGRYEILEQLGRGSMGLVFKAQDPKINRLVAIKTIRFSDEFEDDVIQEIKERFFREAEIAGQLSHPSIVTIHDVGEDQDLTYMAMEYLEGEDLDKFIDKDTLLPLRKVLDIVAKVADALDFAHKNNVIHRDIKPANIMLLQNGQIKVTDFGIAKAISSSRTKTGVILGTPNYMSPEQIMGQKIDARSDIFSLGVLFFQLITGELPFHGDNLSGLLYQITQVKHPSPRNFNPKVPKICEQIIDKAMAKNPDNRFKSAEDMARIIRLLSTKIDELREKRAMK